ncbi:Bud site selection protein 20 [Apophysomyces sp. BC1034]|nr:Bud site selection protein 20 [Apophysomyces sp. BC1015]KAG0176497.1 Bud site selection protein 20 [Apophysomyces sp. BC1021]KAG0186622.1 Bud site selection protein 20 [Apophysomyces sp. BC1034]
MGRLRRSRTHHGIRDHYRKYRTRNYTRDLDQIHDDIKPENVDKFKNQAIDTDKPGLAQNYCVECAKHFISPDALKEHARGKNHKKRVKLLKEEPYTQAEADAAAGKGGVDNGKRGGRQIVDDVTMAED